MLPRCKIHSWTIFVLSVVFKCQYFSSYSRKTSFWQFAPIFSRAVTHSKIVRLTRFFFYMSKRFQWTFLLIWVISLSLNHEAKCQKTEFRGGHLGFWRPSWIFILATYVFNHQYHMETICAKFHAGITKWTIDHFFPHKQLH